MEERKKILIVVDMQNDFIDGTLGTPEAQAIVPNVVDKIKYGNYDYIFITQDTHIYADYVKSREGRHLPIAHCVVGGKGWQIEKNVMSVITDKDNYAIVDKENFAVDDWIWWFRDSFNCKRWESGENFEIEIIGLCSDICVVANAFALQTEFPESEITVDASCCAGTTPEAHKAALTVMKSCHMNVINEE